MTRIGSLCSGYGGLDMGVQSVLGGTVAWHVEYDKDPSAILAHHWPTIPNHGDVKTTDWASVEPVDVLTAGYPCQPFSHAGNRKGTDDPRHLWPDVARAIGVLRPGLVVLENVRGHVSLGLDAVIGDLSRLGYDARWSVVRASNAGAPHGRARVFILATDADTRRGPLPRPGGAGDGLRLPAERGDLTAADTPGRLDPKWAGRDAWDESRRTLGSARTGAGHRVGSRDSAAGVPGLVGSAGVAWGPYEPAIRRWERLTRPAPAPTEPGAKGQPRLSPAFVEWMQGLPAGHVTDVPGLARNAQLKALGNGVVPAQAALALRLLLADGLAVAA